MVRKAMGAVGLGLLLSICGCGGDGTVAVTGTVSWNGEPIPSDHTGHVVFTPVDAAVTPAAGPIQDGKFAFSSQPGEMKVEIYIDRPAGKTNDVMGAPIREPYIPTRYNEETELKVTVSAGGDNDFTLEMEEKPGDRIAGAH